MSSPEQRPLVKLLSWALDATLTSLNNFTSQYLRTQYRPKTVALRELELLHREVTAQYQGSSFSTVDMDDWMANLILAAATESGHHPTYPILRPFVDATQSLMQIEGLAPPPEVDWKAHFTLQEEVTVGRYLRNQARLFSRTDELTSAWRTELITIYACILGYLPEQLAAIDATEQPGPSVSLIDVLASPAEIIERLIITLDDDNLRSKELFAKVRTQLVNNTLRYSGIDPAGNYGQNKSLVYPTDTQLSGEALIETYLHGTPFASLFSYPYPFRIPNQTRFEHCHVIGGTGHGKTQLLQSMILADLQVGEHRPGLLIMDSQGDLIRKVTQLALFDPSNPDGLADKLIIVDPTDIEYPACLNLFDFHLDRAEGLSPLERETILNGTIDLFTYMFGALLGAELTQRQGVLFNYLARLMMVIPGATITTLRQLMEDGEPFRPYMQQLGGTAQAFFETQFFSSGFQATKKQILARLWGVLSNTTLERMFSHERNRIDLYSAMNEGKIVLVNTAKDLLKQDGCQILGRFFIALLGHAVLERTAIPEEERRPFHVYIDEAQEYFDERIEDLLAQARKYKVGITVAHQTLAQLSPRLRAALASNTSIKYAGGVSAKDANELSHDMHCTAEHILQTKKQRTSTEFACFVRNLTTQALTLSVPIGALESLPQMDIDARAQLRALNRSLYTEKFAAAKPVIPPPVVAPPVEKQTPTIEPIVTVSPEVSSNPEPIPPAPVAPTVEKTARKVSTPPRLDEPTQTLGRGGPQHTYLQNLIKRIGQEHGFHATIEEPILAGGGQVDVGLKHGNTRVGVEISITTSPPHELGNVQKCLDAGFDQVFLISPERKHLNQVKRYIMGALDEKQLEQVTFLLPEELMEHLDTIAAQNAGGEKKVRGYTVKVKYQPAGKEAQAKREAVAKVIAGAMKRLSDK